MTDADKSPTTITLAAIVLGRFGSYEALLDDTVWALPGQYTVRQRKGVQNGIGYFYPNGDGWLVMVRPANPIGIPAATVLAQKATGDVEQITNMIVAAWERKLSTEGGIVSRPRK